MDEHEQFCSAALNVKGEHFACDMQQPTPHEIHGNQESGAIWSGAREHVASDTEDCWCEPTAVKVSDYDAGGMAPRTQMMTVDTAIRVDAASARDE